MLEAHFEPTTYPIGCDQNDYRRYFKRGKVYVLRGPLKDRYVFQRKEPGIGLLCELEGGTQPHPRDPPTA